MFDLTQAKSVIETIVLLVMSLWTFRTRSDWDDDSWFFRILNILVVAFLIWQYITLRGLKVGG
jgi:uncharacterized membrane-anchored protein